MSETHKTGALADDGGEMDHGFIRPAESRSDRLNRNSEVRQRVYIAGLPDVAEVIACPDVDAHVGGEDA